jgi:hypothetical protein
VSDKKVWEETWELEDSADGSCKPRMYREEWYGIGVDMTGGGPSLIVAPSHTDPGSWAWEDGLARAKLCAAAPEMVRLLLRAQFADNSDGEYGTRCPICEGRDEDGVAGVRKHSKDCELVAILIKAGVLP